MQNVAYNGQRITQIKNIKGKREQAKISCIVTIMGYGMKPKVAVMNQCFNAMYVYISRHRDIDESWIFTLYLYVFVLVCACVTGCVSYNIDMITIEFNCSFILL